MRLILQTVYENVDQSWIDWWLKENGKYYGLSSKNVEPGEDFVHQVSRKDPTSNVQGTTVIKFEVKP